MTVDSIWREFRDETERLEVSHLRRGIYYGGPGQAAFVAKQAERVAVLATAAAIVQPLALVARAKQIAAEARRRPTRGDSSMNPLLQSVVDHALNPTEPESEEPVLSESARWQIPSWMPQGSRPPEDPSERNHWERRAGVAS